MPQATELLTQAPATSILDEAMDALRRSPKLAIDARRIVRFRLSRYFTVVELDEGSVGSCMSYSSAPDSAIAAETQLLQRGLAHDPLLLATLPAMSDALLMLSLRASLLSALASPLLRGGGDGSVLVSAVPLWDPLAGATSALVIGFGGYMHPFALDPRIERLHVADRGYASRRAEMDGAIARYQQLRPEARITISDGCDTQARARSADVVAITGSALCNGSMEELLDWSRGSRVIVQGQSAAIHPLPLFARGVAMVATTLKPRDLVDIADRGGLSTVLEGGLPWVYAYSCAQLADQLSGSTQERAR